MAGEGLPVEVCCRVLDVSCAGYYAWRFRPPSARAVRHAWLTDVIREVHAASYGSYGAKRVHAELVARPRHRGRPQRGRDADAARRHRRPQRQRASWRGSGRRDRRGSRRPAVFAASGPTELWLTDITEHPTREGKVYCAVVLDAFSRRVVGWSISHNPTAALTCNALGMAIEQRDASPRQDVIHSDHGTQFTSWTFTERARRSGLVPSMGSVGDCYDTQLMMAPVALRFAA